MTEENNSLLLKVEFEASATVTKAADLAKNQTTEAGESGEKEPQS